VWFFSKQDHEDTLESRKAKVEKGIMRGNGPTIARVSSLVSRCISIAPAMLDGLSTPPGSRSQPIGHVAHPLRSILHRGQNGKEAG
jgi:hypothetical protein